MGTSTARPSASITVPADYLEDARRALVAEIRDDSDALHTGHSDPSERDSSARILRRDLQLLDQLLEATEDTTVETEQDGTSTPVAEMLDGIVKVLSERLRIVCRYGPVPMGDVLDIAERLRWAAEEAIQVCPDLAHRLSAEELERAYRDHGEAVS